MVENRSYQVLAVILSVVALLFSGLALYSARSTASEVEEMRLEMDGVGGGTMGGTLGELMRDATDGVEGGPAPRTPGSKARKGGGKGGKGGKAGGKAGGRKAGKRAP